MAYNAFGASASGSSASVMLQGAANLATRFVPGAGVTRSWDPWSAYPARMVQVIIDNMMTIELLLQAATLPGGSRSWRDIAVKHAQTTALNHIRYDASVNYYHAKIEAIINHVRADGSTFHRVIYDSTSGKVLQAGTHQGFSDSSCCKSE